MQFLSKYGTARHIYVPVVKRAVVDFAVSADWTPAAGDVKISKDGGAAANVTNLPTAITMGNTAMWDFSLTATEMQAAQIMVSVADSATKAVEDQFFIIETYGNASGQHAFDLGTALASQTVGTVTNRVTANVDQIDGASWSTHASGMAPADLRDIAGSAVSATTAQLGVNVVNLGGSAVDAASGLINANVKQISTDATAADNLEAALDGTGGVTITAAVTGNITGNLSGSVGSVSGAVGSVTGNVGGNVTGSVGSLAAQAKSDVNAEVVDALATDTYAEPAQGAPAATTTLAVKINFLYKFLRNKVTQTSTTMSVFADDAATVDHKATVSDDGTTYTRGEIATGP